MVEVMAPSKCSRGSLDEWDDRRIQHLTAAGLDPPQLKTIAIPEFDSGIPHVIRTGNNLVNQDCYD